MCNNAKIKVKVNEVMVNVKVRVCNVIENILFEETDTTKAQYHPIALTIQLLQQKSPTNLPLLKVQLRILEINPRESNS